MTKEEIFSCIDNLCQIYELPNDKRPDARGNGYHFWKGKVSHAWYGTLRNGNIFRLDFVARPPRETRDEIYAAIRAQLSGKDYEIEVMQTLLHIFFVRNIRLESVTMDILDKAMCKYQEFMNEEFPKLKAILGEESRVP
jgi:hypothetical protein